MTRQERYVGLVSSRISELNGFERQCYVDKSAQLKSLIKEAKAKAVAAAKAAVGAT